MVAYPTDSGNLRIQFGVHADFCITSTTDHYLGL
jgi:hypothetical protein